MKKIKSLIASDNSKSVNETINGVFVVAIAVYLVYTFSWVI